MHVPQAADLSSESLGSGRVTQPVSGLRLRWDRSPPNSRSTLMNVSEKDRKQDQIFLFSFFFFLQTGLSMGNFPRTTPLLFRRDVCPLRTLWVVFLKAKGRGKEKENGKKNLVIHPWRLDNNKIHNRTKYYGKM